MSPSSVDLPTPSGPIRPSVAARPAPPGRSPSSASVVAVAMADAGQARGRLSRQPGIGQARRQPLRPGRGGVGPHIGDARQTGLDQPGVALQQVRRRSATLTRNIRFSRSRAVSTCLGVNCASAATKVTLAGMTYSGAASRTMRASAAHRQPAGLIGRQEDLHVDVGQIEHGQHPAAGRQHLAGQRQPVLHPPRPRCGQRVLLEVDLQALDPGDRRLDRTPPRRRPPPGRCRAPPPAGRAGRCARRPPAWPHCPSAAGTRPAAARSRPA